MNSPTETASIRQISECFIKPKHIPQESKQPIHFTPWDYAMISVHYIQKGLLYSKPTQQTFPISQFLHNLKESLSLTLVHFYPLAGRLATSKTVDPPSYVVYIDCNNSPGARFVHAVVDLSVNDILSPTYVPSIVQSFFDHDRAINHDGHFKSLLTIQVTELTDGIFIGCSINHAVVDGTSFWHFFNMFSEVFQANGDACKISNISRPPIIERWFPEGHGPIISLPYTHHEQFTAPFESPLLKERIFHFTSESITRLKAKANSEANTNKISSFQALSALVWRCISRTRNLPSNQETSCRIATNNRIRLIPTLSENYFGNCIQPLKAVTTAGELLERNLGWAAWKIHEAIVDQDNEKIRGWLEMWLKSPALYQIGRLFDPFSVMMGSSPRFDKYGVQFGLGKAIAIRSGYAHKFSGKVSGYPGREGGGSVDLEVCLPPESMTALEADREFMDSVSSECSYNGV